jgi:hypothetical protein
MMVPHSYETGFANRHVVQDTSNVLGILSKLEKKVSTFTVRLPAICNFHTAVTHQSIELLTIHPILVIRAPSSCNRQSAIVLHTKSEIVEACFLVQHNTVGCLVIQLTSLSHRDHAR